MQKSPTSDRASRFFPLQVTADGYEGAMADDPQPWEILESREIFSIPNLFQICRQRCRQPRSDKEGNFYVANFRDWVQAVAINGRGELILVKQYRFGSGRLSLEVPGGLLEPGEDGVAGGLRELAEETGFGSPDSIQMLGRVRPNPAIQTNVLHLVLFRNCRQIGAQHLDPMEEVSVHFLSPAEVFEAIADGRIDHALTIVALLLARPYLT